MKTRYTIESVAELRQVMSTVHHNELPKPTGRVEVVYESGGTASRVMLKDDDNYDFSMPFKQFVLEMAQNLDLALMGQDAIPK